MTNLTPLTALTDETPRSERFGVVSLAEKPFLSLASLSIGVGQTKPHPFGLDLPETGKIAHTKDYRAFWVGPNQWMVECKSPGGFDFSAELKAEAPEAITTDQSDGYVCFQLVAQKDKMAALLARLINLDPRSLTSDTAVRTGLKHMTVFVLRSSETRLDLYGMRSYAASLWHALATAAMHLTGRNI